MSPIITSLFHSTDPYPNLPPGGNESDLFLVEPFPLGGNGKGGQSYAGTEVGFKTTK